MRLVIEQKQMLKMVMTTELRQAIELLQLSTFDLLKFIQKEAEENPFIEFMENDSAVSYSSKSFHQTTHQTIDPLDFVPGSGKGMHEQLLEQVSWMELAPEINQMIRFLILNINEQGFLTLSVPEIAAHFQISEMDVYELKQIMKRLEPLGIGAENLRECLKIQAQAEYPDDEIVHELIENYLSTLANRGWSKLEKELGITLEEIQNALDKIKTLNPHPASEFEMTAIEYVTPDITVSFNDEDQVHYVQLNDHYIPNLYFNREYSDVLPESKEVSQYVLGHLRKFEWLQKSILQRRQTIMKIMEVIIHYQEDCLKKGFRYLKPLTLKDVANEIDMHESTVSRATANKIVQTPLGTFELRQFFSTKLATSCGAETSQTTVKEMIRDLIEEENKSKPLSDQKIMDILKENRDIVISRRTVAKYRDELRIPSSSKRKEIQVI